MHLCQGCITPRDAVTEKTGGAVRRPRTTPRERGMIHVRLATRKDTELLVRHRRAMWHDIAIHPPGQIRDDAPRYRRWLLRETRSRRFYGFIAEVNGGTVAGSGAIWLQPVQPRPGPVQRSVAPYVMSMYTEVGFRRRGVAGRLVTAMIEWARRRGYPRISLHASSAGRPVYAKLGFMESNEMRMTLRR
jgi:GNAT superfamily N-acetyltransferase